VSRNRPSEYQDWSETISENLVALLKELREIGRRMEALEVRQAALERRLEALEAKLR
jgi:hypothetical protein